MPQLIMTRRELAGIPVTMTTAATLTRSGRQRRLVALSRISRNRPSRADQREERNGLGNSLTAR